MASDKDLDMAEASGPETTDTVPEPVIRPETAAGSPDAFPEAIHPDTVIGTSEAAAGSESRFAETQVSMSRVASLKANFEQSNKDTTSTTALSNGNETHEAEITHLQDALTKEKELRVAFEDKITSLEDEIEDLTAQLEDQEEVWRGQYEQRRQRERAEMEERLVAMAEEARAQRQEATNLQKQLSDLKKSVSASTRPSTHVTDATFRDEVGVLQYEVQNWVVQNFRRVKIDTDAEHLGKRLQAVVEEDQSARLRSLYAKFESSVKIPILQATISCFLMEVFDEPYLFGLHGSVEWADRSRAAAEALLSVLQPAAYNRCRAVTLDALRQSGSVKSLVEKASRDLAQKVMVALIAVTEVDENEGILVALTSIMKRAIDLAHLLRVQPAGYDIVLPAPEDRYDTGFMEDVLEEGDVDNTIKFATFPAIFKITDEDGTLFDSKNVITKAKVLCNDTED